jgi:RNA polymerase sigma factor (sigma-70 family)
MEHLDRIRQPQHIQAWLVTTARRETLRLLREQNKQRSLVHPDDPQGIHTPETIRDNMPLPQETVEELEEQNLIHRAISALDERCQRLLTLLYYRPEETSYADIASMLDMPQGSVGPTRARCLAKLRSLLRHSGF